MSHKQCKLQQQYKMGRNASPKVVGEIDCIDRGGRGGGVPTVARLESAMRGRGGGAGAGRDEDRLARLGLLRGASGGGAAADGRPWRPETRGGRGTGGGEAGARGGRWTGTPPPLRTLPAVARAATAEAKATRAKRAEAALAAEAEGLARERRDTMLRRRQERLDDEMVAAADEGRAGGA